MPPRGARVRVEGRVERGRRASAASALGLHLARRIALRQGRSNRERSGIALDSDFAISIRDSRGDLDRDRGHVVVRRRVAAELLDRGEDRVDDLARGPRRACAATTSSSRSAPNSRAERVVRLEDAVGAEHEDVAGVSSNVTSS